MRLLIIAGLISLLILFACQSIFIKLFKLQMSFEGREIQSKMFNKLLTKEILLSFFSVSLCEQILPSFKVIYILLLKFGFLSK